jgi:anaerobic selenocysteine-containing dehydrogenase
VIEMNGEEATGRKDRHIFRMAKESGGDPGGAEAGVDSGRRNFIKTAALVGGALALGSAVAGAGNSSTVATPPPSVVLAHVEGEAVNPYPLSEPENIIYSACLVCHNHCPIKVKHEDNGDVWMIQGNPYSPVNLVPWLDYSTDPRQAALIDGKLCPKGNAGVQIHYDPYRIRTVLKRAGPRGSNKWRTIPFNQAIQEIVNGGYLFKDIGEDQYVPGFKDVIALRDPDLAASMAKDVVAIWQKKMTVDEFKQKYADHLDVLIDPDHPDLGPKNNQFLFYASRIEGGRVEFSQRFTYQAVGSINWTDHVSICELSYLDGWARSSMQYNPKATMPIPPNSFENHGKNALVNGKWQYGSTQFRPDYLNAEFIIIWGSGEFEANFGPVAESELITRAYVERGLKIAVIDPRATKAVSKAWRWFPINPDGDLPLALAMIQWIIANNAYDAQFLSNANKAAALATGYKSWTNGSWLVVIEPDGTPGKLARASDLNLPVPQGANPDDYFVISSKGQLVAFDPNDSNNPAYGDLFVDTTVNGVHLKSALQLVYEQASSKSIEEWASIAGLSPDDVVTLAREFTSHGHKAATVHYRGTVAHTNGYYTAHAIAILNLLIGNPDFVGGIYPPGPSWSADSGAFDLTSFPGQMTPFGVMISREGVEYEQTTLFNGYPAQRPWFPYTWGIYHEWIPAAYNGYPYPVKILWIHMANPVFQTPAGHLLIPMLQDVNKIPLIIADDIVLGESTIYADYVFPDGSYLEQWAVQGLLPSNLPAKATEVRQPAAIPLTETVTINGEEMPISMEAVMIAIATALGLPGFGDDVFGPGMPLKRPEDFYLKMVANVAAGSGPGDEVPDASDEEVQLFLSARRYLPSSVFDPGKWQRAVGDWWRKVIYVLNRGGRFNSISDVYEGNFMKHAWAKLFTVYDEPVALGRNSVTGKRFSGVPVYEPPSYQDGSPLPYDNYPLYGLTYKSIFTGKRTIPEYWSQYSLLPENYVVMNPETASALGLKDGDLVKVTSPTVPDGTIDLGPMGTYTVKGRVLTQEWIIPNAIEVVMNYGHWGYGGADAVIDGELIKGDARRTKGLNVGIVYLEDRFMPGSPLTDPIGGQVVYFDNRVNLVKLSEQIVTS